LSHLEEGEEKKGEERERRKIPPASKMPKEELRMTMPCSSEGHPVPVKRKY